MGASRYPVTTDGRKGGTMDVGHTNAMPEKTCTLDRVEVTEIDPRSRTASKEPRKVNEVASNA